MSTHTHLRDVYGDLIASETFPGPDGTPVDTYGDPIPEEQYAVVCDGDDCPNEPERVTAAELPERVTAAELREGDVVGMGGDIYTVERVTHVIGYHEVAWADTNEGLPYAYMGDESWPLISRIDVVAEHPDSQLIAAIREGIREGSTDETALDLLVDALRAQAADWTASADRIRPVVDDFGYEVPLAEQEALDLAATTLDECVTELLQLVGHVDHPDLPLSLAAKLEA